MAIVIGKPGADHLASRMYEIGTVANYGNLLAAVPYRTPVAILTPHVVDRLTYRWWFGYPSIAATRTIPEPDAMWATIEMAGLQLDSKRICGGDDRTVRASAQGEI